MQWLVLKRNNRTSLLKIGDTAIILDEDIPPKEKPKFKLHRNIEVVMCHPYTVKKLFQQYKNATITKEPVPFTEAFHGSKCIVLDEREFFSFVK